MFAYSDQDIKDAQDAVDAAHADSKLPEIEFARVLLSLALEIGTKVAAAHKAAGRPLHEPDFVNDAKRLVSEIEGANPYIHAAE
jgi:hypothetical protein